MTPVPSGLTTEYNKNGSWSRLIYVQTLITGPTYPKRSVHVYMACGVREKGGGLQSYFFSNVVTFFSFLASTETIGHK